jgi:hypothetical protein
MSSVTAQQILTRCNRILQDNGIRWPDAEMIDWLNDAMRYVVFQRPDANMKSGTFTCAAGTRQVLTKSVGGFPTALRLRSVVRNVSSTNKRAIKLVTQSVLDNEHPNWHSEAAEADIQLYVFDPLLPKEFLVYPPAADTNTIEVVYSAAPTEVTSDTLSSTIDLDDTYISIVVDLILARAYAKDAEYAANAQRAQVHQALADQAMGLSIQSAAASSPVDDSKGTA